MMLWLPETAEAWIPDELRGAPERLIARGAQLSDWAEELLAEHIYRSKEGPALMAAIARFDAGRSLPRAWKPADGLEPMMGGSGTFSNWFQVACLQHGTGYDNAAWANLSPGYLALCTVTPTSAMTGSTITEASYTGYARLAVPNTSWSAAVAGGAGGQTTETNSAVLTFAACTAGSSTVIGFAYCTAPAAGNVVCWGTTSSTVISPTQTPAQVAAGALVLGLL